MAYEHKNNTGSLFTNERKTASNHPDLTGTFKDEKGKLWNIAAWKKTGTKGEFYSISLSEKQEKP
jgi:hypothetical protein